MAQNIDDMDKTVFMPAQGQGPQTPTGHHQPKLSDTQEMPAVQPEINEDKTLMMPAAQSGQVRRLTPQAPQPNANQQQDKKKFWTPKRKRAAIMGGGFIIALFIGFMLAGWSQERQLAAEQQRLEQQQMKDKQAQLDGQVTDLQQQKQALELQIKQLEARQADLEKQNQQNALDKVLDAVTGSKGKSSDAQAVKQQIADAQSTVQDLNQKIDTAKAVGQQASAVKDKAVQAYQENQGVINQALGYAKAGAQLVLGWLR